MLGLALALMRATAGSHASSQSVYHLSASTPLIFASGATIFEGGFCRARFDSRGSGTTQSLFIGADVLLANNTNYVVRVRRFGDTNFIDVATIASDRHGMAHVTFEQRSNGKIGHKSMPLPAALDPVVDIASVQIVLSTEPVFTADFTARTTLNYTVQRPLENAGLESAAAAALSVKANYFQATLLVHKTNVVTQIIDANKLLLTASALTPHTRYALAFNGVIATNLTTDAQGALQVGLSNDRGELPLPTQPDGSAHIEEFVDIDIVDVNTNSVLNLTLP